MWMFLISPEPSGSDPGARHPTSTADGPLDSRSGPGLLRGRVATGGSPVAGLSALTLGMRTLAMPTRAVHGGHVARPRTETVSFSMRHALLCASTSGAGQ